MLKHFNFKFKYYNWRLLFLVLALTCIGIVVIGSAVHPEVQGICGWISGDYTVIETKADAEADERY